jgi:hypothetical protein
MYGNPPPKGSRSSAASWFRGAAQSKSKSNAARPSGSEKPARPIISSPIGPVKNSRGPDFVRSDALTMVDAINDCCRPNKNATEDSHTPLEHGDIPVMFPNKPWVDNPVVEKSPVTAAGSVSSPGLRGFPDRIDKESSKSPVATVGSFNTPLNNISQIEPECSINQVKHKSSLGQLKQKYSLSQLRKASTNLSPQEKHQLKPSSTFSFIPRSLTMRQDENIPPSSANTKKPAITSTGPPSKLPKSRTMNVLHGLRSSLSRPSMSPAAARQDNAPDSSSLTSPSGSGSFTPTPSRHNQPVMYRVSSNLSKNLTCEEVDFRLICTAQSSSYWSGRFTTLHDKFSTESLIPQLRSSIATEVKSSSDTEPPSQFLIPRRPVAITAFHLPTRLSHSNTTTALPTMGSLQPSLPVIDEDACARRVFDHLSTLCTTDEARSSL